MVIVDQDIPKEFKTYIKSNVNHINFGITKIQHTRVLNSSSILSQ